MDTTFPFIHLRSLLMVQESNSPRGLGVLILIYIGKLFLLLFGVLGLGMFCFRIIKDIIREN